TPLTLLENIEKLPPGHVLEWIDGEAHSEPYWELRPRKLADVRPEQARDELDSLLYESVAEQSLTDVPLGIWLSGGVDSSTILHYAQNASSSRLRTFSITFRGRSFDESNYIGRVVERYGTEHYELDLNPTKDLADAIGRMMHHLDEPLADAGAVPVWFLAELTRKHATVALSGEGADELFGGYLTYRADLLSRYSRRVSPRFRRGLLRLFDAWPVSDEKIGFEYKFRRFLEGCNLSPDEAHAYWNGGFCAAQQVQLLRERRGASVSQLFAR